MQRRKFFRRAQFCKKKGASQKYRYQIGVRWVNLYLDGRLVYTGYVGAHLRPRYAVTIFCICLSNTLNFVLSLFIKADRWLWWRQGDCDGENPLQKRTLTEDKFFCLEAYPFPSPHNFPMIQIAAEDEGSPKGADGRKFVNCFLIFQ